MRGLSFPAAWLADHLGGTRVSVTNIAPAGEDPPTWQPPPALISTLAEADLVVAVGAGYEAWTATAMLRSQTLVSTATDLDLIVLDGQPHRHGSAGEHSHAGTDPHTWMDPHLWLLQGEAVHKALVRVDPDHSATYDSNLASFRAEVAALDTQLVAATTLLKDLPMAANHPSFNYLARRYGLNITTIDLDPSAAPSAEALAQVVAWKATAGARAVMLWEAAPGRDMLDGLPKGLEHVRLDPLEQPVDGVYNWLAQARSNAVRLERLGSPEP